MRLPGGAVSELEREAEAWAKRLKKVLEGVPSGAWLYCTANAFCVMEKGEDGEHVMKSDGSGDSVDQSRILADVYPKGLDFDVGDW